MKQPINSHSRIHDDGVPEILIDTDLSIMTGLAVEGDGSVDPNNVLGSLYLIIDDGGVAGQFVGQENSMEDELTGARTVARIFIDNPQIVATLLKSLQLLYASMQDPLNALEQARAHATTRKNNLN